MRSASRSLVLAGCFVAVAVPATAQAGTVSVSGGVLLYQDATDARNNVMRVDDIFGIESAYQVRDNAGVTAGATCVPVNINEARCPRSGVLTVRLELGPGNDNATVATVGSERAELLGQDGDDVLISTFGDDVVDGGAGDDQMDGAQGSDTVLGGLGADLLLGGLGNDDLQGGEGNDQLRPSLGTDAVAGGDGRDEVSYAGFLDPVSVSLDDLPGDGTGGAQGNVRSDVEDLVGGENADTLNGSAGANRVVGGAGGDAINGGAGVDVVTGDAGNDTIEARDGTAETVDCGTDGDAVAADLTDVVVACESVQPPRTSSTPPPPPPAIAPPPPPAVTPQSPSAIPNVQRRTTKIVLASVTARDRNAPYVLKVRGLLTPTDSTPLPLTCRGDVTLRVRRGTVTLVRLKATVQRRSGDGPNCGFAGVLRPRVSERPPRGGQRFVVDAKYTGSAINAASKTVRRFVRIG